MDFKSFFFNKIIKESPDNLFIRTENGEEIHVKFSDDDAHSFLVDDGFYILGREWETYHQDLWEILQNYIFCNSKFCKLHDEKVVVVGEPSQHLMDSLDPIQKKGVPSRPTMLLEAPRILQGRIWVNQFVIAFWNNSETFTPEALETLFKLIKDQDRIPEDFEYELERTLYPYDVFMEMVSNKTPQPEVQPQPEPEIPDDWQQELHMVSADKKADVLKARGIRPKVQPNSLRTRQKVNQESVDS